MGYAILADDPVAFNTAHPSVTCPVAAPDRWPTLNDGGDSVVLVDGAGTVIDSSAYPGPKVRRPGRSVERISLAVAGHAPNSWLASTHADRSTAGRENSVSNRHVTEGVELTADPNPFRERTEIRIGLPVDRAHVHLWVYDRAGRKVASLLHGEEGGSRRKVAWGGTGVGGAPLKPGIYILFLEASAPDGRALRARSTVVVARGL